MFSGSKPETSSFIDLKGKYKSKYLTFRDKLTKPDWIEHFLKITDVENMDFEDFIYKYDSEKTFHYIDAPYWKTENYYSNHDFDRQDHERLANALKKLGGKFGMSYYDFPLLSEWFPEDQYTWVKKEFAKAASAKKGEKQNIRKKINFWSFPTILVIDLKRFKSNHLKNQVLINFPLDNLNLTKYALGYKKADYIYELYGVCNHSGGLLGGHYTAYVKNRNAKWYHFNDTMVNEIEEAQIISPKAYCLFYRKKSS